MKPQRIFPIAVGIAASAFFILIVFPLVALFQLILLILT